MASVSVIIVNYNTLGLTQACIESVLTRTHSVALQVVVVDNGSTDGSREVLSADGRITFVETGANLGFGRANNVGLRHATGEYVLFLNSDTLLVNDAIGELLRVYESLPQANAGALGCLLEDAEGRTIHSYGELGATRQLWRSLVWGKVMRLLGRQMGDVGARQPEREVFEVGYVVGADIFASRSVVDALGAFDEDFFMYFEETEMQHRWTRAGRPSRVCRGPRIVHLEGGSQNGGAGGRISEKKLLMCLRSQVFYGRKTTTGPAYAAFRASMLLHLLPALWGRYTWAGFKGVAGIVLGTR